MLQRYVELHTIFEKTVSEIYNYLLPDSDFQNCKSLTDLEKFESVNKSLQKSTSNLSEARKLFDALIEQHDELKPICLLMRLLSTVISSTSKMPSWNWQTEMSSQTWKKFRSVFSNETQ